MIAPAIVMFAYKYRLCDIVTVSCGFLLQLKILDAFFSQIRETARTMIQHEREALKEGLRPQTTCKESSITYSNVFSRELRTRPFRAGQWTQEGHSVLRDCPLYSQSRLALNQKAAQAVVSSLQVVWRGYLLEGSAHDTEPLLGDSLLSP